MDIISGLETLLVHGEGQLLYKVALYCSIFITDNYIERKEIFNLVKKMYNLRSKIVHGEIKAVSKLISKPDIYDDYFRLKKIFVSVLMKSQLFIEQELEDRITESLLNSPLIK